MRSRVCSALLLAVFLLAGCAATPAGRRDPRDPLEGVNRGIYRFNAAADRAVFRPVARGWRAAVPRPIRRGLGNFIGNLAYPTTILNDFLQGKLTDGGRDSARLLINSVLGLGFFDPATRAGFERHDEDFGQTLGKWGVPAGPYLMIPIFGPSSLRDEPAKIADYYTDARNYLHDPYARYGLWILDRLELRASLLEADAVIDRSYDPYAFVRSAWLQRREYQVRDGEVPDTALDFGDDTPPDAAPDPVSPQN